jgi:hypothetical protein
MELFVELEVGLVFEEDAELGYLDLLLLGFQSYQEYLFEQFVEEWQFVGQSAQAVPQHVVDVYGEVGYKHFQDFVVLLHIVDLGHLLQEGPELSSAQ